MALIGGAVTLAVYIMLGRRRLIGWRQSVTAMIFVGAGVLIGAHLLFFIVGFPDWIATWSGNIHSAYDLLKAVSYGASGLVFYGGLFGGYCGMIIFCKICGLYTYWELCRLSVVIPLFHLFGRIGCALEGCCYGIEYHGIFALKYTESYINPGISDDIADFPRFPVQLLEAFAELLIFILLFILYKKAGELYSQTCIYLLIYSIVRFADEFLRGDAARGMWGIFSTSQWISIAVFISVMIYLIVRRVKNPTRYMFM